MGACADIRGSWQDSDSKHYRYHVFQDNACEFKVFRSGPETSVAGHGSIDGVSISYTWIGDIGAVNEQPLSSGIVAGSRINWSSGFYWTKVGASGEEERKGGTQVRV